ncbi:MAG: hypothetical protein ACQESP_12550 [Candidatus Muiribacteriota bacterium]
MTKIIFFTSDKKNTVEVDSSMFKNYELETIDTKDIKLSEMYKVFIDKKSSFHKIYCMSDDIEFLLALFRLYHFTLDYFIYYPTTNKNIYKYKESLKIFGEKPIGNEEDIIKPLYVFGQTPPDVKIDSKIDQKSIQNLSEIETVTQEHLPNQKVFVYKNNLLITEFFNFNFKTVALDNSKLKNISLKKGFFQNLDYEAAELIRTIIRKFDNSQNISEVFLQDIVKKIHEFQNITQRKFIIYLKFLVNVKYCGTIKNYLNSFLLNLDSCTSEMFTSIVKETREDSTLKPVEKYFFYWQLIRLDFIKPKEKKPDYSQLWLLYRDIYTNYKSSLPSLEFISKEKRNKNLIVIFTAQFLSEHHAPTKVVLDRAYHLIRDLNKEVVIINTTEVLTKKGKKPFYNTIVANKIEQYSHINKIQYKDIAIPFYQSATDMPNEVEMINILSIVQNHKPYLILSFGSGNLLADLCSNIVTSACFPLTSDIPISESQIKIQRSKLAIEEKQILQELKIDPESIIIFHLKLKNIVSKAQYSKKDFELPEDKFLICVIGNRLTEEITEEFISMLNDIIEYNTHIVFIGNFNNYNKMTNNFPNLKNNSTLLGFQEHLYDVMKLFDFSANPGRTGGGSVIYFLMHSIPITTLNYGDVHTASKGLFSVNSYDEMKGAIIKNITDKKYYHSQTILAKKVYKELGTVDSEMKELLNKIYLNKNFQ